MATLIGVIFFLIIIAILVAIIVAIYFCIVNTDESTQNTIQYGQPCSTAEGEGCAAPLYCGPNSVCENGSLGSSCVISSSSNQCIDENAYCANGTGNVENSVGTCYNGSLGQYCENSEQCQPLNNVTSYCTLLGTCSFGGQGASCQTTSECGTNFNCVNNICKSNLLGSQCSISAPCASPNICGLGNTCIPPKEAGSFCEVPSDCVSKKCINKICQIGILDSNCSVDTDCTSGLCSIYTNKCIGKSGDKCKNPSQCGSGICEKGICTNTLVTIIR
jgi:hypothetical protein